MKKILLILFVFTLFSTISCKKDYPSDIPKWLKEKIKERKRSETFGFYDAGYSINEYSNKIDGNTIYIISIQYDPSSYAVFDYQGNNICNYDSWGIGNACYQQYIFQKLNFVRHIWEDVDRE